MPNIDEIKKHLTVATDIILLDSVNSTNDYSKTLITDNPTVIIAKSQTDGKGRNGKSFLSDTGGIYMSILLSSANFDPTEITVKSANAVCNAIEKICNIHCGIKWVNDIFVSGKKVCGILVEGVFESAKPPKIIVGIGINIKNTIPPSLSEIATSLAAECGTAPDINRIIAEVINTFFCELCNDNSLTEYKKRSVIIGKEITVIPNCTPPYTAVAVGIDDSGGLIIKHNNVTETLRWGEISVKSKETGYEKSIEKEKEI